MRKTNRNRHRNGVVSESKTALNKSNKPLNQILRVSRPCPRCGSYELSDYNLIVKCVNSKCADTEWDKSKAWEICKRMYFDMMAGKRYFEMSGASNMVARYEETMDIVRKYIVEI